MSEITFERGDGARERVVSVTDLSKTFAKHRALDSVTFDVTSGQMVALIGASGSGKSTLLRHLAGLVNADRRQNSRVIVLGKTVQHNGRLAGDVRRSRADIGFVFQQFNLVGRLSVLANVLVGRLGSIPRWRGTLGQFTHAEKRDAMRALDRVGMAAYAAQRASTLSGGQQQRVAIARTLTQRAKIILADEPIASLDPESSRRVMDALAEINREDGLTVLVSLHQVDYALRYCRRVLALKDGQLVHDAASDSVSQEQLGRLYGQHTPAPADPPLQAPFTTPVHSLGD